MNTFCIHSTRPRDQWSELMGARSWALSSSELGSIGILTRAQVQAACPDADKPELELVDTLIALQDPLVSACLDYRIRRSVQSKQWDGLLLT